MPKITEFPGFTNWWREVGSGMLFLDGEDCEEHARRVALAAVAALSMSAKTTADGSDVVAMPVDEALEFADEWSRGLTVYKGAQGWRVVCMVLADAVRRLRRGEFICTRCSLRKDGEHDPARPDF